MQTNALNSGSDTEQIEVLLDGRTIQIPAQRRSLGAIRVFLETLAMDQQRVLCTFMVDGAPAKNSKPNTEDFSFSRVEGETAELTDLPMHQLALAIQQIDDARALVETAVTLVLINDAPLSREIWWDLTRKLKAPLLTMSSLPETARGPSSGASLVQLRKWQFQQLAAIIRQVDETCWLPDMTSLSHALENRVLPWLEKLHDSLQLWQQTMAASSRLRALQF